MSDRRPAALDGHTGTEAVVLRTQGSARPSANDSGPGSTDIVWSWPRRPMWPESACSMQHASTLVYLSVGVETHPPWSHCMLV